jgi:protease-4
VLKLGSNFRRARLSLSNKWRARRKLPPYIVVSLDGEVVEFPAPRPNIPFARFLPLPHGPMSVSAVRRLFEQLAFDPRVKGVVLKIDCIAGASIYQSLRRILLDFRAKGKRIVAYSETFGPFQYYLACACDRIVMPPSAEWAVLGFHNEYVFLKDALDRVGVGVDVVNVSPFKSAGDQFARNDFSDESRAQAEWLLDARYKTLVCGIAEGRKLDEARVRNLIDGAPYSASEAVSLGLIDAALYEDELEHFLEPEPAKPAASSADRLAVWVPRLQRISPALAERFKQALDVSREQTKRSWISLEEARKTLLRPWIEYGPKVVGVVGVEGLIVPGVSRKSPLPIPLFGAEIAGSASIAQAIRRAEADDGIAAVILYVDSSGGSALASDLIAREIKRLRAKKPVVAYMGGVAASGGYYVSALAQHIVAQPLTVTGSIGVIALKPHTERAYEKFSLHRVSLQRGEHAGLLSDAAPLEGGERAVFEQMIARSYDDFKRVVAEGRNVNVNELEPIAGGRVWTGEMARERGLVDAMGDFTVALEKARELAKLPPDKRTAAILVTPPRKFVLPNPFPAASPATLLFDQINEIKALLSASHIWAISLWQAEKTV